MSILRTLTLVMLAGAFALPAMPASAQDNPFKFEALSKDANDGQLAPSFGDSRDVVTVSFHAQRDTAPPGATVPVAVVFDLKKNWHIWPNEGGAPEGTSIFEYAEWTVIDGSDEANTSILSTQWPETHMVTVDFGSGTQRLAVFEGKAIAFVNLQIDESAATGSTASMTLSAAFQACDDTTCLAPTFDPPSSRIAITVDASTPATIEGADLFATWDKDRSPDVRTRAPIDEAGPEDVPAIGEASDTTFFGFAIPRTGGFLGAIILILLAMVGGFILNLTPCVLPVIPIKIMTLSQHAATPGRALSLGLWMAFGVFAFWFVIGLPVIFFASITDPSRIFGIWWVTFGIGVLIGVMGIGIMGLFTLSLPQSAYMINPKADTAWGSFLFGVMTAVLGLPCFGFVAGALFAGAATLPPIVTLLIFGSIGVGMGAPYLVLSAKPSLVEKIPRTGPASELIKQVMGLLLLAAAAYFIGSGLIALVAEMPWMARQLHWWAIALAMILAGAWLLIRTYQITGNNGPRVIWTIVAIVFAAVPTWYAIKSTEKAWVIWDGLKEVIDSPTGFSTKVWNPYSPARFEAARADGKTVMIDFTAEWCINCKVLKSQVLDVDPVKTRLAEDDAIVTFTADNTARNAPGWELMRELGQTGVPLLAIWGPEDGLTSPWKSTAYTSKQVMAALEEAESDG